MKTQTKPPFDSALSEVSRFFHSISKNSYFIDSLCIFTNERIITVENKYFLDQHPSAFGDKICEVILVDCCYNDGDITFLVQDIRSRQTYTITHRIECPECKWVLMDEKCYNDLLDKKAIEDYCGCSEPKNGSNLLEFDF